ncbi:hypothetical protein MPL1_04882 [Methylophaga lonarensis MPL]|uniref:Lipid/polyisoprenoid-binding YceI-like domain-containing protein n=1 Tax=Methylophaga lonarensis MPL TaxID=1286106 RepID=M7PSN6_9GAMM|nr:YceI family protein [Methylophaga lonarensis]EMR13464.1 hypothetical protein MPL1_04882 [Methylophaga lonarensis MPL]
MTQRKTVAQLIALAFAGTLSATTLAADWQLDNSASRLNFVSIKAIHVAEVGQFRSFSGKISEAGELEIQFDLTSVDTKVELRDDRMREMLFKVDEFTTASLTAEVDTSIIDELAVGESITNNMTATLDLHGNQQNVAMEVLISKLSEQRILVNSAHPVLLDVTDFDLVKGVERLRDVVGLPNISHAVPVTFYMTFNTAE